MFHIGFYESISQQISDRKAGIAGGGDEADTQKDRTVGLERENGEMGSKREKTRRKTTNEHKDTQVWGLKSTTAGDCLEASFYQQLQTA